MKIIDCLERCQWTEEEVTLFLSLTRFEVTDKGSLVVIAAAATLLAGDSVDVRHLQANIAEFGEVAEEMFTRTDQALPPRLHLVGGQHVS
jgi:hypothetical protein